MFFYKKLQRDSELWVERGIITPDTRSRILLEYEKDSWNASSVLTSIASLFAGFSLFLILSANWESLGQLVQFSTVIAGLLLCFCLIFLFERRGKHHASDAFSLLACFAFGVSIWLTAQIFHLDGHFPNGMVLWAFGVLPLVNRSLGSAHFYTLIWILNLALFMEIDEPIRLAWYYPLFFAVILALINRRVKDSVHLLHHLAIGCCLFATQACSYLVYPNSFSYLIYTHSIIFSIGTLLTLFAMLGSEERSQKLFRTQIFVVLLLSFEWSIHGLLLNRHEPRIGVYLIWFIHIVAQCLIIGWRARFISGYVKPMLAYVLSCELLIMGFGLSIAAGFLSQGSGVLIFKILINAVLFFTGIALILFAIRAKEQYMFNTGVWLLIALGFCRYISLIGDYLSSAFLFLMAAVILSYSARLWSRVMEREE